MVSPGAFNTLPLAQPTVIREPQAPDNNCKPGFVKLAPRPLNVTVSTVEVAVNLYQTSYTGVPQIGKGTGDDNVEPITFPAVLVQEAPGVNEIAPEQLSLLNSFHDTMLLSAVAMAD